MKHFAPLLFLLLVIGRLAQAQSNNPSMWCPAGATWTYNYGEMPGGGTLTVRYARDTVVAGQPAQLLVRRINPCFYLGGSCVPSPAYAISSVITRVLADRVEVQANGQFYILYDFAASRGSTWLTPMVTPFGPCASGLAQVTVDSVGRQMVGGRSLRWFRAHLTPAAGATMVGGWAGRIYEQLGNVAQYMQPQSPICHGTDPGYMGAFVSFRAAGWPTIGYNATTSTLLATGTARAKAAGFGLYPNPTAGNARVGLQWPAASVSHAELTVFDIAGRQVRRQRVASGQLLDVAGLPAGVYTVLFNELGQDSVACRLVVQ